MSFWSSPFKTAWGFVKSAIKSGLEKLSTFATTVAAGIKVEEKEYVREWTHAEEKFAAWDHITDLGKGDVVQAHLGMEIPFAYAKEWVMVMHYTGLDPETGAFRDGWLTVESDTLLTMERWESLGSEALYEVPWSDALDDMNFDEYEFYHVTKRSK